jgi:hypothetical protein
MVSILLISLTPGFSRVLHATRIPKPFQRFSNDSMEAVETANYSLGVQFTWLKPGVNAIRNVSWELSV